MSARLLKALPALAVLAGIGILGSPPSAQGAFKLMLVQGANVVTVEDDMAGDLDPTDGLILFSGSVGTFVVNVEVGQSKPILGGANIAQIDLNSANTSSAAGGLLTVSLTDTDYVVAGPTASTETLFGGTLIPVGAANLTGSTVLFQSFASNTNGEFALTTPLGSLGPFGPGAFSGSVNSSFSPAALFSLTTVLTLNLTGAGLYTGDGGVTVVSPEPASLAMALIAVPLAGGVHFLRRRKTAA
jgi:hypothetical protein